MSCCTSAPIVTQTCETLLSKCEIPIIDLAHMGESFFHLNLPGRSLARSIVRTDDPRFNYEKRRKEAYDTQEIVAASPVCRTCESHTRRRNFAKRYFEIVCEVIMCSHALL